MAADVTLQRVLELQSPDAEVRAAATADICQRYEPLVHRMAQRYVQWPEQFDDLKQVARMGMVLACQTFNIKRWKKRKDGAARLFAQHAVWSVRHELADFLANDPRPFRLPSDVIRRIAKLRRVVIRLSHELGRDPTLEEIIDAGVIPKDKYTDPTLVITHMLAYGTMQTTIIDEEVASDALTPEEMLIARETQHELERQR